VILAIKISNSQVKSQGRSSDSQKERVIDLNKWMRSILMAVSDTVASLIQELLDEKKIKGPAVNGYTLLYFHCWLCDGRTDFAYKNTSQRKEFTIECSRCGVENRVTLS
jgi:hypothetical protein